MTQSWPKCSLEDALRLYLSEKEGKLKAKHHPHRQEVSGRSTGAPTEGGHRAGVDQPQGRAWLCESQRLGEQDNR